LNFLQLVFAALLNVALNFVFLGWFGLIGSAYATLLSYLVVFVMNQVILYRKYQINTLKVFEGITEWYKLGWQIFRKKVVGFAWPM
jgi:lipopolysaccharide exporter